MFNTLRRPNARSMFVSACALVALSLVLSACGSGDSSSSGSSSTPASTESDSGSAATDVPVSAKPGEEATGTPVKVGVLVDEGGTAVSQPEARESAEAVVAYANEQLNGLGGHPIEVVACGTKGEAAAAADCANQLVQDDVVAVVVPQTGQGATAAPIITKAGLAYVIPTAASPVEYTLPNVFNLTSGLPGTIGSTAVYGKEHGVKRVVIFAIDAGNFIAAVEEIGNPAFEAAGIELEIVPVPEGTPDATPQVAAGLKSDPEVLSLYGDTNSCIAVFKALDAVGATGQRWMGEPCLAKSAVDAVSADNFEGSVNFTTSDTTSDDPEARTYRWVMSKYAPDAETGGPATFGYQAMLSFIRAASDFKGEPTAESVLAAIKSAKDVRLAVGHGQTFTCDGKSSPGLPTICGKGTLAAELNGSAEVTSVKLIE